MIIVTINQKGGVGKSTLAFHLAHAAVGAVDDAGKPRNRVLCLDFDTQGNLSQFLTGDLDIIKNTTGGVGELLEAKTFAPSASLFPGIDLLHGHEELDRYDNNPEIEARGYNAETRNYLRGLGYDHIVIDTPPAVGFRQLAALCWADIAVVPMEPTMPSVAGFQNVLSAIDRVAPINPGLKWCGVLNRANMRAKSHRNMEGWVRSQYGSNIVATLAARTAIADAMQEDPAQPVWARRSAPKDLRVQWLEFCNGIIAG